MTRIWQSVRMATYKWYMQAKADATGMPVWEHKHYHADYRCKRCTTCGAGPHYFEHHTVDSIDTGYGGLVCEEDTVCSVCGTHLSYWAYGESHPSFAHFKPANPHPDAPPF